MSLISTFLLSSFRYSIAFQTWYHSFSSSFFCLFFLSCYLIFLSLFLMLTFLFSFLSLRVSYSWSDTFNSSYLFLIFPSRLFRFLRQLHSFSSPHMSISISPPLLSFIIFLTWYSSCFLFFSSPIFVFFNIIPFPVLIWAFLSSFSSLRSSFSWPDTFNSSSPYFFVSSLSFS